MFKYKLPFDWYFCYRHSVDYHNNLRHALPSILDKWVTYRWECRVFAFILAISDINTFLFYTDFYTVGYVRREYLHYWSFFGSWCGNLLTIYTLGNRRRGSIYFQTTFIRWLLHQGMREDLGIISGFSLQKLPITSTAVALNTGKR